MTPSDETMPGRDHGGGLDAAVRGYGGTRADWIDLSTGINPCPYPLPDLPFDCWTALPDAAAEARLLEAAREFWSVPSDAGILAAPGASALIARIPTLAPVGSVRIPHPTYNEHAAAFEMHGWTVTGNGRDGRVLVHPNNPDGRLWEEPDATTKGLVVIDESFTDVDPNCSLIRLANRPGLLVLKSFGKFWGLAGLRLGFAIGDPELIQKLRDQLGPWPVSGPAIAVATAALRDEGWTAKTRGRLVRDADRLDTLLTGAGAKVIGGTTLFRLCDTDDATALQDRLARHRIWTRVFPYSRRWIRVGLPGTEADWQRLEAAL